MGRGDKKTRRGKIFAGSHGKANPKAKTVKKHRAENKSEAEDVKVTKEAKKTK